MMRLAAARQEAEKLRGRVSRWCDRAEIAGSIRRQKAEVKDVELVVIPRWEDWPDPSSLFGEPMPVNVLHEEWVGKCAGDVRWIKPGTKEVVDWEPKADGKYWRGLLPCGLKLDLFIARPENWGAIFLIRTGSAEFSEAVVTHAKRVGKRCSGGMFTVDGNPVATPEERDVFKLLNLRWVDPVNRTGPEALR